MIFWWYQAMTIGPGCKWFRHAGHRHDGPTEESQTFKGSAVSSCVAFTQGVYKTMGRSEDAEGQGQRMWQNTWRWVWEWNINSPNPSHFELVSMGLCSTTLEDLIISDLSHCPNLQHWISCAGSCGTSLMFNAAWWYFVVPFNLSSLGYLGSTLRLQVPGSLKISEAKEEVGIWRAMRTLSSRFKFFKLRHEDSKICCSIQKRCQRFSALSQSGLL